MQATSLLVGATHFRGGSSPLGWLANMSIIHGHAQPYVFFRDLFCSTLGLVLPGEPGLPRLPSLWPVTLLLQSCSRLVAWPGFCFAAGAWEAAGSKKGVTGRYCLCTHIYKHQHQMLAARPPSRRRKKTTPTLFFSCGAGQGTQSLCTEREPQASLYFLF